MNHTIILRHADREEIKDKNHAPLAKLTFKGRLKALQHGVWLRIKYGNVHEIHSSRTERCVQTASIIRIPFFASNGYKTLPEIKIDSDNYGLLSTGYLKTGCFDTWMEDVFLQATRWKSYSEMFLRWADKGLISCTLHEFGRALLSKYLTNHNVIAVTHDSIIGPLMEMLSHEYCFKLREYMIWPNPLAGCCIEHENKRIYTIRWLEYSKEPTILF